MTNSQGHSFMKRFSTIGNCLGNRSGNGRLPILLFAIFCCGNCGQSTIAKQAITGPATTQTDHTQTRHANLQPVDEKIIKEISAIRSRLGGGVADQLKGMLPDSATSNAQKPKGAISEQQMQAEFEAELRKLANRKDYHPPRGVAALAAPPEKTLGTVGLINVNKSSQPSKLSNYLRLAARNLETAAAALEEAKRFSQADELRESARQLWIEARRPCIAQSPASTTFSNPETPAAKR